jgi:hypothetical protein
VGFGLDTLARFYSQARERTQEALSFVGGDRDHVEAPNLAASLVPPYRDEVTALAHLMKGRQLDDAEAQELVYDVAFGYVLAQLSDSELPGTP